MCKWQGKRGMRRPRLHESETAPSPLNPAGGKTETYIPRALGPFDRNCSSCREVPEFPREERGKGTADTSGQIACRAAAGGDTSIATARKGTLPRGPGPAKAWPAPNEK